MHPLIEQIVNTGVVAILRGIEPKRLIPLAEALANAGVGAIEITLNSDGALDGITALREHMGSRLPIGAGTVLTGALAEAAIAAGAQFVLTPHLAEETLLTCRNHQVPAIIGAMTPSEAYRAFQIGADLVKIFPAGTLGPGFFKDLRGPLSQIPTMAVGGINAANAADFIRAGTLAIGAGSQLLDQTAIAQGDWAAVGAKAARITEAVRQAKS